MGRVDGHVRGGVRGGCERASERVQQVGTLHVAVEGREESHGEQRLREEHWHALQHELATVGRGRGLLLGGRLEEGEVHAREERLLLPAAEHADSLEQRLRRLEQQREQLSWGPWLGFALLAVLALDVGDEQVGERVGEQRREGGRRAKWRAARPQRREQRRQRKLAHGRRFMWLCRIDQPD